jgi:tetratricopeptide (TPR) repeat protein
MSQDDPKLAEGAMSEALLQFLATGPHPEPAQNKAVDGVEAGATSENLALPDLCPERGNYLSLAMGNVDQPETDLLLAHATGCEACGSVLAQSIRSLEGSPSPEETAAIAKLIEGASAWQGAVARDLAASQAQKRPSLMGLKRAGLGLDAPAARVWGRWLAVAACLAVIVSAALFAMQWRSGVTEREIAAAYTQLRAMELRIPQAGYAILAPGGHTRGGTKAGTPSPLLAAKERLAEKRKSAPQNPHWLQLQARADILEERYDPAIVVLDRLIAQGPATPDLLADAASAYYQRGLVSGSESDRATALSYLKRADAMAPADPVVLFNEAIVMEDRAQTMNAVEVWNRYITVERDPQWLAEGKRKLQALEETLNRQKTQGSRINAMPVVKLSS